MNPKKLFVRFILLPFAAYLGYCATRGFAKGLSEEYGAMTEDEKNDWCLKVATFRA